MHTIDDTSTQNSNRRRTDICQHIPSQRTVQTLASPANKPASTLCTTTLLPITAPPPRPFGKLQQTRDEGAPRRSQVSRSGGDRDGSTSKLWDSGGHGGVLSWTHAPAASVSFLSLSLSVSLALSCIHAMMVAVAAVGAEEKKRKKPPETGERERGERHVQTESSPPLEPPTFGFLPARASRSKWSLA